MKKALLAVLVLCLFSSCFIEEKKKSFGPQDVAIPGGAGVYSIGRMDHDTVYNAVCWKDGVKYNLVGSDPCDIYYDGQDVYILGWIWENNKTRIKYWKNGISHDVTDGTNNAYPGAFFFVGTDMYICGYETINNVSFAKYWKNGVEVTLSDGTTDEYADSIYVSGSDVYVCGSQISTVNFAIWNAKYWKNGVGTVLSNGTTMDVASKITGLGTDVYIAGTVNNKAVYWLNGAMTTLSTYNGGVTDMFISGTDIYISGNEYKSSMEPVEIAKYWLNGTAHALTDGSYDAMAKSIFINGSNVYIAGSSDNDNNAFYWLNGTKTVIGDGSQNSYIKKTIVVQ